MKKSMIILLLFTTIVSAQYKDLFSSASVENLSDMGKVQFQKKIDKVKQFHILKLNKMNLINEKKNNAQSF